MLRENIISICPTIFAGLTILFIVLKIFTLKNLNVKTSNYSKAFIKSLMPVSRQERKNMTNTRLANYYARSNDINFVYYVLSIIVLGTYFLLSSIN